MRRIASLLILVFLFVLSVGCQSQDRSVGLTPTMTTQPDVEAIATSTLTKTPVDLPTRTPTHTAAEDCGVSSECLTPSLQPTSDILLTQEGPWLLGYSSQEFVAMNPDGKGLTYLDIPDLWSPQTYGLINRLPGIVSPQGWLVAFTGVDWESFADLALTILRLPSSKPVFTIPLLSQQAIAQIEEDAQAIGDMKYYPSILDASLHWSPDGRTLAFIAAIDGSSYDLYIYDTQTSEVRRLTDKPKQEFILDWSLDGSWIVYMEADYPYISTTSAPGFGPMPNSLWAISTDGSVDTILYDIDMGREVILGWLSSDSFVVYNTLSPEFPPSDLRIVNVTSGKISSVFPGEFANVALDEVGGVIALTIPPHYRSEWDYGSGLFLVNIGEKKPQQIKENFWGEVDWLREVDQFFAWLGPDMHAFKIDGEIVANFEGESCPPYPSPDGQWLAFVAKESCSSFFSRSSGVRFFNVEGEFQDDIAAEGAYSFLWQADSEGIYFTVRNKEAEFGDDDYFGELMYVSVHDWRPVVIHSDPNAFFYAWVAP